jgi:hypothetical protein
MGTSGAFGGSTTAPWQKVQSLLDGDASPAAGAADGAVTDEGTIGGDDPVDQQGAPPDYVAQLAAAIAEALKADDPSIRPRFARPRRSGDSGLFIGDVAGTRARGSSATPPTGRRRIARGSARAGRAIGAGYALARRDAAALAEYGLDLGELSSKSRVEQMLAIADAFDDSSAGPDDLILRQALIRQLNRVLGDPPPEPIEALRDLAVDYTFGLALIEIEAYATRAGHDSAVVIALEADIRSFIEVTAGRSLNLEGATLVTPSQFEHGCQEIVRSLLAVLPREARS